MAGTSTASSSLEKEQRNRSAEPENHGREEAEGGDRSKRLEESVSPPQIKDASVSQTSSPNSSIGRRRRQKAAALAAECADAISTARAMEEGKHPDKAPASPRSGGWQSLLPKPVRNVWNNTLYHTVKPPNDESTLLLPPKDAAAPAAVHSPQRHRYYDHGANIDDPLMQQQQNDDVSLTNTGFGKETWKKIANKVNEGEFLLLSSFGNPDDPNSTSDPTVTTREEKMRDMQNDIRNRLEFSATQCMIAIALYLSVAVMAFSFVFDHWTIVDSMYFAVVTFTTIGYGDLTPDTYAGRIFTCIFALSGVACLGIALGVIGNHIIEAQETAVSQTSALAKARVLTLFSSSTHIVDHVLEDPETGEDYDPDLSAFARHKDATPTSTFGCLSRFTVSLQCWRLLWELVVVLALVSFFVALVASDPGIDTTKWGDGLYYAIITACTVGYGDFAPSSQAGRALAIVFIPLAVGAMGHFLSIVANWMIEGRQQRFHKHMQAKELTMQDLEVMDEDGDGKVTRAEFMEFMLVAMNAIDQSLIDELRDHFRHLDQDNSGSLSRQDLIAAARKKLQSPHRKLELARYKRGVISQSDAIGQRRERAGSRGSFWDNQGSILQIFKNIRESDGDSDPSSNEARF